MLKEHPKQTKPEFVLRKLKLEKTGFALSFHIVLHYLQYYLFLIIILPVILSIIVGREKERV